MAREWKEGDEAWYFRPNPDNGNPPPRPYHVALGDPVRYGPESDPIVLYGYSHHPHPRIDDIYIVELGDRALLDGRCLFETKEAAYAAYSGYLESVMLEIDAWVKTLEGIITAAADQIDSLGAQYNGYLDVLLAARHDGLIPKPAADGEKTVGGETAAEGEKKAD